LGFSLATKWPGIYAVAICFLFIMFSWIRSKDLDIRRFLFFLIPPLFYLLGYLQYFLQGHSFIYPSDIKALILSPFSDVSPSYRSDFLKLHQQIWWYQNKHDLEHPYGTTPIYCVPKGLNGPKTFCPWVLDTKPVYYSYEQYDEKAGYIYALGNPLIFWAGLASVIYLFYILIKTRDSKLLFVLLGYFIFWVPWIFSPRIMFLSHYLPSIPFLAIALGISFNKLYISGYKYVVYSMIALFIFAFFYFYPVTSGFPIEVSTIDKFIWIRSWR
jgi:dolichyl-phosphate-mannose--protein O-mannosyl transferase